MLLLDVITLQNNGMVGRVDLFNCICRCVTICLVYAVVLRDGLGHLVVKEWIALVVNFLALDGLSGHMMSLMIGTGTLA
jgi:hypothetical protein